MAPRSRRPAKPERCRRSSSLRPCPAGRDSTGRERSPLPRRPPSLRRDGIQAVRDERTYPAAQHLLFPCLPVCSESMGGGNRLATSRLVARGLPLTLLCRIHRERIGYIPHLQRSPKLVQVRLALQLQSDRLAGKQIEIIIETLTLVLAEARVYVTSQYRRLQAQRESVGPGAPAPIRLNRRN